MRNHSFGAREPNSPMLQKPFSPISSTTSSKSNLTTYFSEDQNIACETTLQSTLPFTTPIKTTTAMTNEENNTQRWCHIRCPPLRIIWLEHVLVSDLICLEIKQILIALFLLYNDWISYTKFWYRDLINFMQIMRVGEWSVLTLNL